MHWHVLLAQAGMRVQPTGIYAMSTGSSPIFGIQAVRHAYGRHSRRHVRQQWACMRKIQVHSRRVELSLVSLQKNSVFPFVTTTSSLWTTQ